MKAAAILSHGDTSVFRYMGMPDPVAGPSEVVVRVEACALNHLDIWVRQGLPGFALPMPHILGNDICGVVESWGSEVKHLKKGQRVILSPGVGCKRCPECLRGADSLCAEYVVRGFQIHGGYAQFAKAHVSDVIPVSNRLTPEEWAAAPLTFVTAWHMLVERGRVQEGDTVLVQAAGSGVGAAAIQMAKLFNCFVFTTAGTDAKCRKAKELGADVAINYNKQSFADVVKKETKGRGADVIIEHIGGKVFEESLKCLGRGGRLVTCGATAGGSVSIDLRFFYMRQLTVAGSYMGGRPELLKAIEWTEKGRFKPVVDKVFPLKDAAKAHEHMLARRNFGKIIVKPGR